MKNSAHVAKNGDTGEKRKPYQRNPIVWIQCFHNIERQNEHTQCFIVAAFFLFFYYASSFFWSKIYIAFSTIRNCMYKRDMQFRPFYWIVRHFVCNLKIPWLNSVITPFKVLIISIADWRMFWWRIETKPCNKSIFIKYLSITASSYHCYN